MCLGSGGQWSSGRQCSDLCSAVRRERSGGHAVHAVAAACSACCAGLQHAAHAADLSVRTSRCRCFSSMDFFTLHIQEIVNDDPKVPPDLLCVRSLKYPTL